MLPGTLLPHLSASSCCRADIFIFGPCLCVGKISAGDHVLYTPTGARPVKGKVVSVAGDKAAVFLPGKGEVSVDTAMLKKVRPHAQPNLVLLRNPSHPPSSSRLALRFSLQKEGTQNPDKPVAANPAGGETDLAIETLQKLGIPFKQFFHPSVRRSSSHSRRQPTPTPITATDQRPQGSNCAIRAAHDIRMPRTRCACVAGVAIASFAGGHWWAGESQFPPRPGGHPIDGRAFMYVLRPPSRSVAGWDD